ncbi:MAG: PocR ligand-binding domain-containing protein [Clostridia bacterium]|nr:PocR ligand-binding domain-containing protein [Clostridia bacterium]
MKLKLEHEKLNKILMDFYTLSHVRIVIYDSEFVRVAAYPEKSCDFCNMIKQNPGSKQLCRNDEISACKICSKNNSLYIYKCHAGLIEAVAPIKMNDLTLGYIMFGQILNKESNKKDILSYALRYIDDEERLNKSFAKLKVRSNKQIEAMADIMNACTNYLWITELIKIDSGNRIYLLTDYINNNISEDISVDKLCSVLSVSRVRLYDMSHKYYGMSIAKYIRQKRISIASKYISENGYTIAEAAQNVGFYDYNYFSKVFKKETGMTPTEYKNVHHV